MEKSLIHFVVMFPSSYKTSVVAKPSNSTFDFPSASISSQCSTVLGLGFTAPLAMRRHKLNALLLEFFAKAIRIISFVTDHSLRFFTQTLNRFMGQFHFRRTGRVKGHSQRNTLAVCQYHELRALATLGFADFEAPFLAATKVPSIKLSPHWIRLFLSKVSINLRQIFNHVPSSAHILSRLQHVLGLGYLSGKSFHRAPVRRIHKIPSRVSRLFFHGRPLLFSLGNSGSMRFHCFSVKYIARLIGLVPPMNLLSANHL